MATADDCRFGNRLFCPALTALGGVLFGLCVVAAGGCAPIFPQDPYDVFSDRRVAELTRAAAGGDIDQVDQLVSAGVDVNARGRRNVTPLLLVLNEGRNQEGYQALLKHGADPNLLDRDGRSVMHIAAADEDPFWLREALAHGGDPNLENTGNRYSPNSTPIFYAIATTRIDAPAKYRIENIQLLIDAGADLSHRDSHGRTPLRTTVGKYGIMHALLEAGADHRIPVDRHGNTLADMFRYGLGFSREVEREWFCRVIKYLNSHGENLRVPPYCDEL